MNTITVFTPTYNRAGLLPRLYKSLINQTDNDFEWVIVDDGSIDDTKEIVKKWCTEGLISIKYEYQVNGGKARAHNRGVALANSPLFICVDSDDYLVDSAIHEIKEVWNCCARNDCVGILANRCYLDGTSITKCAEEFEYSTLIDAHRKYGLRHDTSLVFRTEVLKRHQFPEYEGEKFVTEALIYDQIDEEGVLYYYNKPLIVCEYQESGLSASIHNTIAHNPKGYFQYSMHRYSNDKYLRYQLEDLVRLISISLVDGRFNEVISAANPVHVLLSIPFGILRYFYLYKKHIS